MIAVYYYTSASRKNYNNNNSSRTTTQYKTQAHSQETQAVELIYQICARVISVSVDPRKYSTGFETAM